MAAPGANRNLWVPGRVIVAPTQSFDGGTFPYGGVEIGETNGFVLMPYAGAPYRVMSEGLGDATDNLEPPKGVRAGFQVRGWDNDAVTQLLSFGDGSGSVTQHKTFEEPGDTVPGASALTRALVYAFIPDDTIHSPGCIIYAGVAYWSEDAQISMDRNTELILSVEIDCQLDATGRRVKVGRVEDLAL